MRFTQMPLAVPTGVCRTTGDRPPRARPVSGHARQIQYLLIRRLFCGTMMSRERP
jgi:hypothetical protein